MSAGTVKMGAIVQYNTTQDDRDNLFNKGYTVLPATVLQVEGTDDNSNSIVSIALCFDQGINDSTAVLNGIHYDVNQENVEGSWFELPA